MSKRQELVVLYQQMADMTLPKCKSCRVPLSCCSPEYCEISKVIALEHGVELQITNHPKLPFMGQNGCVVPPHLRPFCTLHTCAISSMGFDKDLKWTDDYFKLREKIDELEVLDNLE